MTTTIFDDVDRMTAAIRPLLKTEDERRSLEVRSVVDGKMLEVRLRGAVQLVGRNSLEHTRERNDWAVTAQGCLDRLRMRHSMAPPVTYTLEDTYREINLVLLGVFKDALSPTDYDGFVDRMNTADVLALEDEAARLKALNAKIAEDLTRIVAAAPPRPVSAVPWTGDILKGRRK